MIAFDSFFEIRGGRWVQAERYMGDAERHGRGSGVMSLDAVIREK
jgi:hypothetical protein